MPRKREPKIYKITNTHPEYESEEVRQKAHAQMIRDLAEICHRHLSREDNPLNLGESVKLKANG